MNNKWNNRDKGKNKKEDGGGGGGVRSISERIQVAFTFRLGVLIRVIGHHDDHVSRIIMGGSPKTEV